MNPTVRLRTVFLAFTALLGIASLCSAQGRSGQRSACDTQPQKSLARAVDLYGKLEIDASRSLLLDLLTSGHYRLAKADEVQARKYLGAAYAVVGKTDSAVAVFQGALSLQPDLALDPSAFTRAELDAFARARQQGAATGALAVPYRGCGGR